MDELMPRTSAWMPELAPLTADMLSDLLAIGWTTSEELERWAHNRLAEPRKSVIDQRLTLMRLRIAPDVPRQ